MCGKFMPWISMSFKSMIIDTMKVLFVSKRVNECQKDGFLMWAHDRVPLNLQWLVLRIGGANFLHCLVANSGLDTTFIHRTKTKQFSPNPNTETFIWTYIWTNVHILIMQSNQICNASFNVRNEC